MHILCTEVFLTLKSFITLFVSISTSYVAFVFQIFTKILCSLIAFFSYFTFLRHQIACSCAFSICLSKTFLPIFNSVFHYLLHHGKLFTTTLLKFALLKSRCTFDCAILSWNQKNSRIMWWLLLFLQKLLTVSLLGRLMFGRDNLPTMFR